MQSDRKIVVAPTMRRRGRRGMVRFMPESRPIELRVQVERDSSPISGRVALQPGADRPFAGWTELFAALEAAVRAEREKEGSDVETE
jgi:hypothetical protein